MKYPNLLPKLRHGAAAAALLGVMLTATLLEKPAAHAQGNDNDYVDVGIILEVAQRIEHTATIAVVNNGSRTAYDVEVVLDIVYPEDSSHFYEYLPEAAPAVDQAPVGSWSRKNNNRTIQWSIPELGGLKREILVVRVYDPDHGRLPHEFYGQVTTSSFESDFHKGNNTSRVWSYVYANSGGRWQAGGNYSVAVSVDNPSPSPGDTVNFTITTERARRHKNYLPTPPIDLEVAIDLTDGLSVSGDPTITSGSEGGRTVPDSVSYSNGVFKVGTLKGPTLELRGEPTVNSVTLPVEVSSNAVVNQQCLTATLTGNPPPGTGPYDDDVSDNVAKECLGQRVRPLSPLASSQVDLFNIYPCVGNTDPPCDNADDVRVRAVNTTVQPGVIMSSGKASVHVPDKPNREYDSHTNSVNSGDIVSWQIPVTWDASEFNAVNAQWTNLRDSFTASGVNGGAPPGKVHIRAFEDTNSELLYKMIPDTTPPWIGEDTVGYNPGQNNGPYTYTAEFEKLGTYKLQFTAKLTRATRDGDEDCDPNASNVNQRFCATESSTFHVGPIAELEVRDGGTSSHVPADRNALTIVAANNGPDEPAGGARVTGLPTGAEVIRITQGRYNGSTGVWNVGELKVRDYYRSAGMSEPTLVLGASAGDTATVRIASAKNYEVCVGPKSNPGNLAHTTQSACEAVTNASWNSVPVYDFNTGNNTATITATRGTGGIGPDAPGNLRTQTGATTVTWDEVGYLHGVPVSHYEVQWLGSGWTTLDRAVYGTQYGDGAPSGRRAPGPAAPSRRRPAMRGRR